MKSAVALKETNDDSVMYECYYQVLLLKARVAFIGRKCTTQDHPGFFFLSKIQKTEIFAHRATIQETTFLIISNHFLSTSKIIEKYNPFEM